MWGWAGVVAHMRLRDLATSSTLLPGTCPCLPGTGNPARAQERLIFKLPRLIIFRPQKPGLMALVGSTCTVRATSFCGSR